MQPLGFQHVGDLAAHRRRDGFEELLVGRAHLGVARAPVGGVASRGVDDVEDAFADVGRFHDGNCTSIWAEPRTDGRTEVRPYE
jgi:hypothetical protein